MTGEERNINRDIEAGGRWASAVSARLAGEPDRLAGDPTRLSGEPVRLGSEPAGLSGDSVRMVDDPVCLAGDIDDLRRRMLEAFLREASFTADPIIMISRQLDTKIVEYMKHWQTGTKKAR